MCPAGGSKGGVDPAGVAWTQRGSARVAWAQRGWHEWGIDGLGPMAGGGEGSGLRHSGVWCWGYSRWVQIQPLPPGDRRTEFFFLNFGDFFLRG